jgi:hypothetical protein
MPKTSSGVAVGFINTVTMANGAIFHPLIGKMLDYNANNSLGIVEIYSQWDYRFALSIIPISLGIAAIIVWFIRETHHNAPLTKAEKGAVLLSDVE